MHGCMCKLGYRSERVFFVLVYEVYFLPPSTPSTPRALSIFPLLCGLCGLCGYHFRFSFLALPK